MHTGTEGWACIATMDAGTARIYECVAAAMFQGSIIIAGGGLDSNIDVFGIAGIDSHEVLTSECSKLKL